MGMDQTVVFSSSQPPAWEAVADLLTKHGFPVQMRMIDGQLAFPDEMPEEGWSELRAGTDAGMVTIRREADRVLLVVWGNAEPALQEAWNALVWAFATAGVGQVVTPSGSLSAEEYRAQAKLPESLRSS